MLTLFDAVALLPLDWIELMKAIPHIVIYDDQCPLCTFQMRVLTWLDWFNVVSLVPLSAPKVKSVAPQLTRKDLLAEGRHIGDCTRRLFQDDDVPLGLLLGMEGKSQQARADDGGEKNVCDRFHDLLLAYWARCWSWDMQSLDPG